MPGAPSEKNTACRFDSIPSIPQSPEGNHFHTDPDDGDLRLPSIAGTDPASPARLPVYP